MTIMILMILWFLSVSAAFGFGLFFGGRYNKPHDEKGAASMQTEEERRAALRAKREYANMLSYTVT